MACIRWSYDSAYFRGLCTNTLEPESENTSETCVVCVVPVLVEEASSGEE